jgi:DNA (cytosine-5)-methyltransferase 1
LDLFCGAGLGSAGARDGGAEMVAAIDLCAVATGTYAANFPEALVINKRLEQVVPAKLRDAAGDIDLLLASPECTNHTCAKGSVPRSEKSRATAMQIIRFAKAFLPRWIVMENVVNMRPWSRYGELIAELRRLGYHLREQVLDAARFGVPQSRKRLFVICDREMEPDAVGPSANASAMTVAEILDPPMQWRTTPLFRNGRAPDTLARARRAMAELGKDEAFLIVYYGTDGCGGWQPLDRPLRTVTTVDRFAYVKPHKDGHVMRMLQVPELKRAMGVKASYQLPVGTRRDRIRLLGNGVCPPVMKRIVKSLVANA